MHTNKIMLVAAALVALSAVAEASSITLGTPFSDHMVLQRERPVPVWGWAQPGAEVSVSFAGQVKSAKADANGKWRVTLDPLATSKEPRVLKVNEVEVRDVLVGEVWLVAGQSNTELPLWGSNARFRDRQGALVAQLTRRPNVRYAYACDYDVEHLSPRPRERSANPVVWRAFTPENLMKKPSFSAMAVYFARDLEDVLDVPIGLVGAYWGGTNIDAWTPRSGYEGHLELTKESRYDVVDNKTWVDTRRVGQGPICGVNQQPTILWNTMWAPLAPFAARGLIWYQGCHNGGEGLRYGQKMHALYEGWAKEFENPDFKLYFAQIAPWSADWFNLRLGQANFAAEEKNAGMVVTADIGNSDDIHPADKEAVGRRLALLALNRDYGFTDIKADSPAAVSAVAQDGALVVSLTNATSLYAYQNNFRAPEGCFEIAGTNGLWRPAELVNARIDFGHDGVNRCNGGVQGGTNLVLRSAYVKCPVMARHLARKPWTGCLFNEVCLPLGPFMVMTDELRRQSDLSAWMCGKVGVFFHYLLNKDTFAAADDFDVKGLVANLKKMNVDYVIFTLGQNSGYYCAPNPVLEEIAGYRPNTRCSKRDIPGEIIEALKGSGIRFGLYLPCQPATEDDQMETAFGFTAGMNAGGGAADRIITAKGAANWGKAIEYWSHHYGDGVDLWWFDGGYDWLNFDDMAALKYKNCVRRGNPRAVVAFNAGIRRTSTEGQSDYWAGEETRPFEVVPDSRWRQPGRQWHCLTFLGKIWGDSDCRFTTTAWGDWMQSCMAWKGAVTVDMHIDIPSGKLNQAQVDFFAQAVRHARQQ